MQANNSKTYLVPFEKKVEANEYFDYGITFEFNNETDKALEYFKKAIECDPEFAEAYNKLGDIYMKKAKYDDAILAYQKSIELKPDVENSHFDLGCAYLQVGKITEAEHELQKALELDPNHFEIYGKLCAVYIEKKEYDKALECLNTLSKTDPTNIAIHFYKGLIFQAQGKKELATFEFGEVVARYLSLLKFKPNFAEANYFIGLAYFYNKNYSEAEKYIERAIALDTDKIDFHYSLGLTYSDADAFYIMANIKKAKGNEREAYEFLNKAIELEPKNEKFKNFIV